MMRLLWLSCLAHSAVAFQCWTDTGGSCNILSCKASRGATDCKRFHLWDHRCICQPGYCVNREGACVPKQEAKNALESDCDVVTGGQCSLFWCKGFRGPTDCQHSQCLCKPGYCQHDGICKPRTESRNKSLLPYCQTHTGGTCYLRDCPAWRGPATCTDDNGCVCKPGYCSDDGICYKDERTVRAIVAPINAKQRKFPGSHGKIKTALCLSGGGSRALAISSGIFRAMENLDLMKHIDAVSSCSGGSWASAVYMFADMPFDKLLGKATDPTTLTMAELEKTPPALGAAMTSPTLGKAATLFVTGMEYPDFWEHFVSELILRPFNLDRDQSFMAADEDHVAKIKAANPQLAHAHFLTPQPGRPKTFVMMGALLAPIGYVATNSTVIPLEMSPDYVGSPFYPNDRLVTYSPLPGQDFPQMIELIVGGGLVESFAFGGKEPPHQDHVGKDVLMAASQEPFSLAKAVGVSSNGPASTFTQSQMQQRLTALNANADYWPILSKEMPGPQKSMTYQLGDGGNLDNSALLQMLQRGAERLIVVTSTDLPLPDADFCSMSSIATMAEWVEKSKKHAGELEWTYRASFGFYLVDDVVGQFLTRNQVFKREELAPLLCEMRKKKDVGAPVVVQRHLRVVHNPWWGIEEYDASVIFVYNEKSPEFEAKLPADTQEKLAKGKNGPFSNFPHYALFFQTHDPLALSNEQVNLLAAQAEYSVTSSQALIKELLHVKDQEPVDFAERVQTSANEASLVGDSVGSSEFGMLILLSCILGIAMVCLLLLRIFSRPGTVSLQAEPLLG